jgi:hypothetical protein
VKIFNVPEPLIPLIEGFHVRGPDILVALLSKLCDKMAANESARSGHKYAIMTLQRTSPLFDIAHQHRSCPVATTSAFPCRGPASFHVDRGRLRPLKRPLELYNSFEISVGEKIEAGPIPRKTCNAQQNRIRLTKGGFCVVVAIPKPRTCR